MRSACSNWSFRRAAAALVLAVTAGMAAAAQDTGPPGAPGQGAGSARPPQPAAAGTPGGKGLGGGAGVGGNVPPGDGVAGGGSAGPPVAASSPKSGLEEMLEKALKNNPDLRIAAAKVQEAEAELSRTRLEVTRKVVRLYRSINAAQRDVDGAAARLAEIRRIAGNGRVSKEELEIAEQALARAKETLAATEADLPYLLGEEAPAGLPGGATAGRAAPTALEPRDQSEQNKLLLFAPPARPPSSPTAEGPLTSRQPQGRTADRIREALDKDVNKELKGSLGKLLAELEKDYGLTFIVKTEKSPVLSLHFDHQRLGSVLQALADAADVEFVVRDYGILVAPPGILPPDAVLLHDFWRSARANRAVDKASSDGDKPAK